MNEVEEQKDIILIYSENSKSNLLKGLFSSFEIIEKIFGLKSDRWLSIDNSKGFLYPVVQNPEEGTVQMYPQYVAYLVNKNEPIEELEL